MLLRTRLLTTLRSRWRPIARWNRWQNWLTVCWPVIRKVESWPAVGYSGLTWRPLGPVFVIIRKSASVYPSIIACGQPGAKSRTLCCTKSPTPWWDSGTIMMRYGRPRRWKSGVLENGATGLNSPSRDGSGNAVAASDGSGTGCSGGFVAIVPAPNAGVS